MTKETMTVHEALCKLKISERRIEDMFIKNVPFISCKQKADTKINGVSEDEARATYQGNFDKLKGIMDEVNAIKAALSLSNASTKITVNGQEMTIAEAIYYLDKGLVMKKRVLKFMQDQYNKAVNFANDKNNRLDDQVERYLSSLYGSKEKVSKDEIEETGKKYREMHTYELVDPVNLKDRIDEMSAWINEFESSVDSAIQTSNATTYITVEF